MKNIEEYLLDCLAEEAGEIVQDCGKCARFGMDETRPEKRNGTNREALVTEIHQLIAVAEMLGIIDHHNLDQKIIDDKKAKVAKYLDYSRQRGRLEYEERPEF